MTITTYSSLRDEIAGTASTSWSHRNDLLAKFDTLLQLVEQKIYTGGRKSTNQKVSGLRVRVLETRSTASLSTSSRFLALPDNFLEARRAELEYSSVVYPLKFVPAPELMEIGTGSGTPWEFTVTSQYEFNLTPDVAYTMEVQHYAKATAISSSNSTNNVLTNFPSIYLYGCLAEAFKWSHNAEKAALFNDDFLNAIEDANEEDKWARVGPAPQMVYHGSVA